MEKISLYQKKENLDEAVCFIKRAEEALDEIFDEAVEDLRWIRGQVESQAELCDSQISLRSGEKIYF